MIKCNAIKADGTQCTRNAKYDEKCGNHRNASNEAVLDQIQMLNNNQQQIKESMNQIQQQIQLQHQQFISVLDKLEQLQGLVAEAKTLFSRIISYIPILNRIFT